MSLGVIHSSLLQVVGGLVRRSFCVGYRPKDFKLELKMDFEASA